MKQFCHRLAAVLPRRHALHMASVIAGLVFGGIANLSGSDVAFFFALDADLKAFAAEAKPAGQPVKVGERTVHRLELGAHRVYAVKMGSGTVETAVSVATLLARFRCELALSVGPVGALDDALVAGNWYEADKMVAYQHGSWTNTGFEPTPPATEKAASSWQSWRDRLTLPPLIAATAKITVASGEVFVSSSAYRTQLQAFSGAQAVDMNLFGLRSACENQHVPLFSWRVVSDRADDQAGETFRAFVSHYDGAGGRALAEVVRRLPTDPASVEAYPVLKSLLKQPAAFPATSTPAGTIAPEASPP